MSYFLSVVLFLSFSYYGVECRHKDSGQLQKLKHTDEYDCMDIYKQPAFDNVLLKNHKIQMDPSSLPKFKSNNKLSFDRHSSFPLQAKDNCPEGMVPIQRSRMNNLTDLKSISKLHLGNIRTSTSGRHVAAFHTKLNKPGIYGARAVIDLYNPAVKMDQVSMALIWVEGGPPAELNSIQYGWAVNPRLYGDNLTRATTYWTADGSQKTGCYNLICPGFVQVNPKYHVGIPYEPISSTGGKIYITQPMIYKDPESGNWWLFLDTDLKLGYWPKEILPHFSKAAMFVQYGGLTYSSPNGLSPPMGNGRFPTRNIHDSCFFAQLQTVNKFNNLVDIEQDSLQKVVDNISCYDAKHWGNRYGRLAQTFSFGGPGGICGL
ncbi:hypothetical protein Ddye_025547 [Dipteronia dyeriana]|uniref:Neprosin PEP catalytic domain-containing protein n=1 Tax=Dipteronia dyeriana TaxID=168575 RepID=A0AAD9TL32_9ROSI|nr:hypothetical protein Ddye_025547 [Dipteronia dyeriana]